METTRIVIIGAGSAGIAAGTRLLQTGFKNVLVLEAENRFGGRVHTIPFGDNVVDLGAQWCHGEKGNAIYQLVKYSNMLQSTGTVYEDYKCVRSNKEVLSEDVTNILKSIIDNMLPSKGNERMKKFEGSLGTYLTEAFWRDLVPEVDKTIAHEYFENYKKFESSIEACDTLFEASARGYLEYWICEGDLLLNWKDKGFRSFLRFLMKSKSDEEDDLGLLNKRIQYNSRVRNIEWQRQSDANVRIHLCNGGIIDTDHVICTVSLGVLKETHHNLFTPALPPAKCRAIDGLKLGTVDKFFLELATPFEPEDWSGFWLLWREEDLLELRTSNYFWLESVFGFYRVSCQPRLLQGWIIGPHARYMETLPEAEVLAALLWLFKKFFTFQVPAPLNFLRTRWYTNPSFRGSYTFRTMYAEELRAGSWDLASPLADEKNGKPSLLFAGEATHTHYYSTVHGAVESGWREAERLTEYYRGHNSQM
ncbi:spermine oxidase-like [Eurosta solidaginis]|uniref:spermine oxidase-like n=1 Tax=Eurosta solidaginis TaxID=178769 RepID=UPI0035317251